MIFSTVAQQIDKLVLFGMNMMVSDSLAKSCDDSPSLEEVLTETTVDTCRTAVYALTAPGEHIIYLQTRNGPMSCRVRVRPTVDPQAPLILYHHGLNEVPYTGSWSRIFRQPTPFPAHTVCIQAPHHDRWRDPFSKGFVHLTNVYQMFAASLRLMEVVQSQFEQEGAAFTIAAGVSWGGITSLLYEAFFQRTRAVVPMVCSPDLAQVMWDTADLFARDIPISYERLKEMLDFTHYYDSCQEDRVFPLMGAHDLFFQYEHHWQRPSVTIPEGHITALWRVGPLREHILEVLQWASEQ
jgi:hypothetical protein